MPHVPLSPETLRRVDRLFSPAHRAEASRVLVEECGDNLPLWYDNTPEGLERIRFAVLKLSTGDLDRLRKTVGMAQVDWRDVLVTAGFANSVEAHKHWLAGSDEQGDMGQS
jgi:hypothetical protein